LDEWNRKVLEALGDLISYTSTHRYWENSPDYYSYMDIINSSGALAGKAEASLVTNESLTGPFAYDKRNRYVAVTKEIQVEGNHLSYSFPAHSFTQIKVGIKNRVPVRDGCTNLAP
jgi:hypothetical protein